MAQFNPQDFRWSLIEHPQSTAMVAPEDSQWISFRQPVKIVPIGPFSDVMGMSVDLSGSYALVNTAVLALAGTDYLSHLTTFGNVPEYVLWDFIDPPQVVAAPYGTYFFAIVPTTSGTDYGTIAPVPFGTYRDVVVFLNPGTDYGTLVSPPFGTYIEVSQIADAGTESGTNWVTVFGTALQIVFTADAGTNHLGVLTAAPFGTYA